MAQPVHSTSLLDQAASRQLHHKYGLTFPNQIAMPFFVIFFLEIIGRVPWSNMLQIRLVDLGRVAADARADRWRHTEGMVAYWQLQRPHKVIQSCAV